LVDAVVVQRVDTSRPWEHPDSLDPQIEIFAPDGFLPQNLVAWDDQPGVDLNASLNDAVLPLTGLYVIAAETTRGHGEYRLSFSFGSLAPPAEGERVFALSGADQTVPVGSAFETVALTLDPRGYPISGATLAYTAQSSPDNLGTVGFVQGAHALTNPDGSSFKDVVFTSAGKAEFGPSFITTFSSEPLAAPQGEARVGAGLAPARGVGTIPRYQPVAHLAASMGGLRPDGTITLRIGSFERLPIEPRHARKEVGGTGHRVQGLPHPSGWERLPGATSLSRQDAAPTDEADFEPIDASTAIPLPEPPREMIARAQGITSCTAATLRAAGTTAAQVNPPYTVTLTDLTPSTGQTQPNGEVGVEGIHGHRIEKTARLKLDITDATGQAPTYPVLVQLAVGGPRHGTLILNPDGSQVVCDQAAFLWHESVGLPNDQFAYTMGTYAAYVGVEPDPNNPGQVRPVWGTAEALNLAAQAKALVDGQPADPLLMTYGVHPEPGKPDHFACWEGLNLPCGDVFAHWTGIFSGMTLTDAYHLEDAWGNATFGYTDTAATQPGSGVSVQFTDQTAGMGGDFAGYTLVTQWPTNPAPSGQLSSTLTVDYPDDPAGDWLAGTVTKTITYDFSGGGSHLLVQKQNYDARFGVDEGAWPMTVSPGAGEGAMPKTASGDTPRLVLLALSGTTIPSRIPAGPYYSIVGEDEPSLDPTHVYRNTDGSWNWVSAADQDVALETAGGGEFRLSLVDGSGTVVPGTSFRVHRCPRGEHLTAESPPGDCTLGPVDSEALTGVLSSLTLNEAGSQRGYLGIELTEAPVNPGTYFILVESIGSTPYRIRWQSQLFGRSAPEEDLKGGFVICTVLGGEILDENFQRVAEMLVDRPTQAYVRIVDPNQPAGEIDIAVSTYNSEDLPVSSDVPVAAARVGNSSTFIGAIVLTPLGYESLGIHHEGASYAPQGPEALVDAGKGLAVALRNNFRVAYQSIFLHPRLAVEWLNEQGEPSGEQITRIVKVPDPTLCDHSLYVEETLLRVFAKNLLGRRLTKVDGLVRLDEKPDTAFPNSDDPRFPFTTTLDWQYAYQGNRGASSDLRQDRAPDTDPFAAIVLANGQTETLRLRSVAGPRLVTDNLGLSEPRGFFVRTWKASIEVCESLPNTPCENTPVNRFVPVQATVDQWVDQQTYHRHSPGGGFQRENGQNEVRDWLEAVVWDALSDCASRGELMDYVCSQVWELKEEPGSGADHEFAHVDLDSSHGVFPYQIYVYPQNFGWDAFRWDTRLGLLNYGFLDDAHGVLTSVALHKGTRYPIWCIVC